MNKTSAMGFTVLIERRIQPTAARRAFGALATLTALSALALALVGGRGAHAQTSTDSKLAEELWSVAGGGAVMATLPGGAGNGLAMSAAANSSSKQKNALTAGWTKDINGVRYVRVLIVSRDQDGDMAPLRQRIVATGGSVLFRYQSVTALLAIVPAARLQELAARADVQSISPDRAAARSGSALEKTTGAQNLRAATAAGLPVLNGTGVGIAVLDSGVMGNHGSFADAQGRSRRIVGVDFLQQSDTNTKAKAAWTLAVDQSIAMVPGSPAMHQYQQKISSTNAPYPDPYGHGSHVAAVAAGRATSASVDTTGIAPGATLVDVKVLDGEGMGQLSDVLRGIDWVLMNAKTYNIRVMNLSLAADSTESWQTDPLCRAARSAVAAGITVVVAAGNYGRDEDGQRVWGAIGSPGHDPSVITVGSTHMRGSAGRGDDTVNDFSSRGPTRGSLALPSGARAYDHLLKPDLVAPGNRIVSAMSTSTGSGKSLKWSASFLPANFPELTTGVGTAQNYGQTVMTLSGTSVAAPAVSGAVALMLQANPGLTPPLVKAILQYTAQPLPSANLLEQGTGMLNIDGAVQVARALRTDIAAGASAGTLVPGATLLAGGRTLPAPASTVEGTSFAWSRMITAGGNRVLGGTALFTQYQPIYDPTLAWASGVVRRRSVSYWPAATGVPANTYPKAVSDTAAANQTALLSPGVLLGDGLAGQTSSIARSGMFIPVTQLSGWLGSGSGLTLGAGVVLSGGLILSEGVTMAEGLALSEGVTMAEGLTLSEGVVMAEGVMVAESATRTTRKRDKALRGE
jgi:serine protease AprX